MMDAVLRAGPRAGLGRVRRYARDPALAATWARWSPRRCSRGCRSASTRSRSCSTCASRRARSRSRARCRGRSPPARRFGAPVQGRLVDRIGARRVLLPLAVVHAVALGAIVGLRRARRADRRAARCAASSAGFAIPPTSSVLRSMWTDLLEPRLHQAAYALDSTMIELIFISGPLLTAAIAAVASPAGALIVSAVAVVTGTAIFTALPPTRHVEPEERARAQGPARRARLAGRAHARLHLAARRRRDRHARGRHPGLQPRRGRRGRGRRAARDLVVRQRGRRAALRHAAAPRRPAPDAPARRRAAAAHAAAARRSRRRCG